MSETREAIEQAIREAAELRDYQRAATLAVETYGREVLGFMIARLGEQQANDVFSDVLEDLWRGLPGFGWRCSLRSWIYTLARHAISHHLRGTRRRREALHEVSTVLSAVAERVRTDTASHLKTPIKNRFRDLRAQLSDDDQSLLILRIDRNLSWRELAHVMSEGDELASEADLTRATTRLRQRFQNAKERLRKLAEADGLLAHRKNKA